MGIQRWDRDDEDMHDHPEGDYVLFADHENALSEQHAALAYQNIDMYEEVLRLRAELAAKSKDAERWQKWMPWMRRLNLKPFNLTKEIADIDSAMGEGNDPAKA